jgi:hypothetical protein
MDRHFAYTTSPDDPNFANLQVAFWDLAVRKFGWIKARAGQDGFFWSTFATEAAVVIVLAGTAISELLGQNTPSKNGRVPDLKKAAATLYDPNPVPPPLTEFIEAYDALRHFGEPKWELIHSLMNHESPARLCLLLNAAADVWARVLDGKDAPDYPPARYRFTFEGFEEGPTFGVG